MIRHRRLLVLALALVAEVVQACSVPVFRYALERWQPDIYELVVLHRGKLADSLATQLTALTASDNAPPLTVQAIDVAQGVPPELQDVVATVGDAALPQLVLRYPPAFGLAAPAWHGDPSLLGQLADSPARRELARRLIAGQSAVWVLLRSGDQEADAVARQTLATELGTLHESLKLPHQLDPDDTVYETTISDKVKLQVQFSVLEVDRGDPGERVLVSILLHTEPGLLEGTAPMAFAVFGRGRVLPVLAGRGIGSRHIGAACSFLVGPCSCQAKQENPGVDLLMTVAWDDLITGALEVDTALPPLAAPIAAVAAPAERTVAVVQTRAAAREQTGGMRRNVVVLLMASLLVLVAGTVIVLRSTGK